MKFSIGYNHDIKLLNILEKYKDNIDALYFPIPRRYLGSGRVLPQKINYANEIPLLIKKCKSLNIKSQLLLNATNAGNKGLEQKFLFRVIDYIQKLRNLGLDSVIIANPLYIGEVKKQVKGITVESSINCYVKTVEHALYLKDMGVDILTIDRDINRSMPLIKEIKTRTGLKIKLLLNEGCLRNCPFRKIHFDYLANSTKLYTKTKMIGGFFTLRWCAEIFIKNPAKIFSIPFILPDALKYYTQFVDFFKISTRGFPTSLIEFCLKSYISQNFNGNLLLLLDNPRLRPYIRYIDTGYLNESDFTKKMFECAMNCDECNYCDKLVDEALITDSYFLEKSHPIRIEESKGAIKTYNRILKTHFVEDVTYIYADLARAHFILKHYKEYEEAIREANRLIDLMPHKIDAYLMLGFYYEQANMANEALKLYKEVLKAFPFSYVIVSRLLRIYLRKLKVGMLHLLKS